MALLVAVLGASTGCGALLPRHVAEEDLRAVAADEKVRRFYEQNDWRAAWSDRRAAEFEEALVEAPEHGLSAEAFRPQPDDAGDPARREVALTRAALAYAQALAGGMVDPTEIHSIFTLARNDVDVVEGLRRALADGSVDEWLQTLPPQDAEYQALSAAYLRERRAMAPAEGAPDPEARARARQLAVNLERRRWLAREPATTRIDVNLAAATMAFHRPGSLDWTGRVIPGSPENATPQLGETFDQLVVNPPWRVPESIAEEEILPRGPDYMARNDMYVEDGRVIQRPGPGAALGQVKFDMQNRYAIYLHDTPAKALFDQPHRHRSHGCVRVEGAVAFARRLAEAQGRAADFDRLLASGETGVVELPDPVAVRLLYHTAYLQDGRIQLTDDVYGWDDAVAQRMGLGAGRARNVRAAVDDLLGP